MAFKISATELDLRRLPAEELLFLRSLLAGSNVLADRRSYEKWLRERGDPRADFLEVASQIQTANKLPGRTVDYDSPWRAFMDTLGQPFRPFRFRHGRMLAIRPDEYPFTEEIGTRGKVLTFDSAFRSEDSWDLGLPADLNFLLNLHLDPCAIGAAQDDPVRPFVCDVTCNGQQPTAAEVIAALRVRGFRSDHIQSLEATSIRFPGYHPGTSNDEIHDDDSAQHVFFSPEQAWLSRRERWVIRNAKTHRKLKNYVAERHLWNVLLHCYPFEGTGRIERGQFVVLFVVGMSPHGKRLMGVVTREICHNLCD